MNRRRFVLSTAAAGTAFTRPDSAAPVAGPGFHLGCITYNTLKDFDVETIIRVLEGAGFEGVELRTGHKHGIEPSISQEERLKVRRRFEERFSARRMAKDYLSVYRSLAEAAAPHLRLVQV